MEQIWNKACQSYGISVEITDNWFRRIQQRLSQDTVERRYHNWQELLVSKEQYLKDCSANIVLAAFFQYYAFDGKRTCIEENCVAFNEFCRDANWEDTETQLIVLKLLGDKCCDATPFCDDEINLLQDMDLMILGASEDEYKRYAKLLRQEYSHLNDGEYKQMRLKVLQTLLTIPNIFSTDEFQAKYEQRARTNIRQEIEDLKQ